MSYPFTSLRHSMALTKKSIEIGMRTRRSIRGFRRFVNRMSSNSQLVHFVIISKMHFNFVLPLEHEFKRINYGCRLQFWTLVMIGKIWLLLDFINL